MNPVLVEAKAKETPTGPFQTSDSHSDIVLLVEDKKLYFNKTVLSMSSPVFDRMFTSDFREKGATEIPLPDKKYADVVHFLKQIHPVHAGMTPVTDDTLLVLLALAKEYQVEHIRTKCEQYIGAQVELGEARDGKGLDTNRLMLFLAACDQHDLHLHCERLQQLATERPTQELTRSIKNYDGFPSNSAMEVLGMRCEKLGQLLTQTNTVVFNSYNAPKKPVGSLGVELCSNCMKCVTPAKKLREIMDTLRKLKLP